MIKKPALHNFGNDSQLRKSGSVPNPANNSLRMRQAMVAAVHSELLSSSVGVTLVDPSGSKLGIADWPYPGFVTSRGGAYGGAANNLHGLYASPQVGMSVLTGFREGSMHNPIVIGSYALPVDVTPAVLPAYTTPITSAGHMSDDVVMGHYSGAYIAMRSSIPIPGEIDIKSPSSISLSSQISILETSLKYSFETTAKSSHLTISDAAGIELKTISTITLDSTTSITLKSTAGVTLNSSLSINLKTDNFSVQDSSGNKISFVGGLFKVTSSGQDAAIMAGNVYAYYGGPTQVGLATHTHITAIGPSNAPTPGA